MAYLCKLSHRLAISRSARAALAGLVLAGCTGGERGLVGPDERRSWASVVTSVSVSPSTASGTLGQSVQFTATARDSRGTILSGQMFTWTSTDSTIVRVSATGYATAVGVGTAHVVATDLGVSGFATATVSGTAVAAITVTPATASGAVGMRGQFTATLSDASGTVLTGRRVFWSSSAPAVASVDTTGLATALAAGTATITAYSEGVSGTAAVTVTSGTVTAPGAVTDLAVTGTTDSTATLRFTQVSDGTGAPASYDIRYAAGSFSWGSAATVSLGTCAAPVAGTAVGQALTCTVKGLSPASAYGFQLVAFRGTLNVDAVFGSLSNVATGTTAAAASVVASVSVSPASASGTVGQSAPFTATVRDAAGNVLTSQTVTWSSSNTAVVTVTSAGVATAVGAGTASVIATAGGKSGQATITVSGSTPPAPTPTSVTVSPASATLTTGGTQQFTATVRDASGNVLSGQTVTWSSGNTAVATVNGSGLATAVAAGTATITATSSGLSGTASLTVSSTTPPPSGGSWPNEPSGFTTISDNPFNLLNDLGWSVIWNSSGYGTIGSDPAAPFSPSGVFQVMYPSAFGGGSAPATEDYPHAAYTEVFAGFWWKPSSPWQNHSSNVNKIAFWYTAGGSNIDIQMYGPAPYYLHLVPEFPSGSIRLKPNVTATAVTLGQWHRIEWHLRYASTPGGSDGVAEWWLDGVLQGRYTNLVTPADAGYSEVKISPTWGGIGDTKSENDYYWYDQVHLSRK